MKQRPKRKKSFVRFADHSNLLLFSGAANGILQAYFFGSSCVSFAGDVSGAFVVSLPVVSVSIV